MAKIGESFVGLVPIHIPDNRTPNSLAERNRQDEARQYVPSSEHQAEKLLGVRDEDDLDQILP